MEEVSVQRPVGPAAAGGGITLPGKELLVKTANLDGLEGPLREAMELKDCPTRGGNSHPQNPLTVKKPSSEQVFWTNFCWGS